MTEKSLDVTNMEQLKDKVSDVKVYGDPGDWVCICKASSEEQNWMRSTKAMQTATGVLVQVSSQYINSVAEALTFIPGATILQREDGTHSIN